MTKRPPAPALPPAVWPGLWKLDPPFTPVAGGSRLSHGPSTPASFSCGVGSCWLPRIVPHRVVPHRDHAPRPTVPSDPTRAIDRSIAAGVPVARGRKVAGQHGHVRRLEDAHHHHRGQLRPGQQVPYSLSHLTASKKNASQCLTHFHPHPMLTELGKCMHACISRTLHHPYRTRPHPVAHKVAKRTPASGAGLKLSPETKNKKLKTPGSSTVTCPGSTGTMSREPWGRW